MDFVKTLLGDDSCDVDGTATSRNPISGVMDQLFASSNQMDAASMMGAMGGGVEAGGGIHFQEGPSMSMAPQQVSAISCILKRLFLWPSMEGLLESGLPDAPRNGEQSIHCCSAKRGLTAQSCLR